MPHASPHSLGKIAETQAVTYLQKSQYTIKKRNYRFRRSEVDIIAQKQNTLLFIEVKARKNSSFGFPETFVTPKQQRNYQEAATHYITEKKWQGPIRFDIIAINSKKNRWHLTHFKDAFY